RQVLTEEERGRELAARPRAGLLEDRLQVIVDRVTELRVHHLYGRNLPFSVICTRGPSALSSRPTARLKLIALMMPSPKSSWISALIAGPETSSTAYNRQMSGSVG